MLEQHLPYSAASRARGRHTLRRHRGRDDRGRGVEHHRRRRRAPPRRGRDPPRRQPHRGRVPRQGEVRLLALPALARLHQRAARTGVGPARRRSQGQDRVGGHAARRALRAARDQLRLRRRPPARRGRRRREPEDGQRRRRPRPGRRGHLRAHRLGRPPHRTGRRLHGSEDGVGRHPASVGHRRRRPLHERLRRHRDRHRAGLRPRRRRRLDLGRPLVGGPARQRAR